MVNSLGANIQNPTLKKWLIAAAGSNPDIPVKDYPAFNRFLSIVLPIEFVAPDVSLPLGPQTVMNPAVDEKLSTYARIGLCEYANAHGLNRKELLLTVITFALGYFRRGVSKK